MSTHDSQSPIAANDAELAAPPLAVAPASSPEPHHFFRTESTAATELPTFEIRETAAAAATPPSAENAENAENPDDTDSIWLSLLSADWILGLAPPWLVSMVTHLVGFVVMALILLPNHPANVLNIEAFFAERLGEQLDEDVFEIAPVTLEQTEQVFVPMDLPPTVSPNVAAPSTLALGGVVSQSNLQAPDVAMSLSGRERGRKEALLRAFGGNQTTEDAVAMALEWLNKNFKRGSWSLRGPYTNGSPVENRQAATAMALLAFQGAGHTHQQGEYQETVTRAWKFMLNSQDSDGSMFHAGDFNHRFYTHALATMAICELYGMTRDEAFRQPAQAAVDYLVEMQTPLGGWRYDPREESDTSVTGWVLMALQSGRMAGLVVPSEVFENIGKYLDLAATEGGARYGYKPSHADSVTMTAEGLLCRQYLGWKRDDIRLKAGVLHILDHPISWREPNVYYWYYATQVAHHMEGDIWDEWNSIMRQKIPAKQETMGGERGSWSPAQDRWGMHGGRLFTTCFCTYMLEVYYRHLPLYSPLFRDVAVELH